jgi:hypothetical protein
MKITLPHWAALLCAGAGAFLLGAAQVWPSYATVETAAGGFLVAAGTGGALTLPSILTGAAAK